MSRLHPRLLSLDNQMEAFWQEYKRKQGLPVHPQGKQGVSGSTEGRADEHKSDGQGEGRRQVENRKGVQLGLRSELGSANLSPKHYQLQVPTSGYQGPSADSLWASSHISFHQSDDLKSEQEFVDTGNRLAAKYQKKRFSWSGLVAVLAVAAVVVWLTYSFVEGF